GFEDCRQLQSPRPVTASSQLGAHVARAVPLRDVSRVRPVNRRHRVVSTGRHADLASPLQFSSSMKTTTAPLATISLDTLASVTGGFLGFGKSAAPAAAKPAPTPTPTATPTPRPQLSREEQEDRMREREEFRDWERSHPFGALLCQGDRSCKY